MDWDRDGVCRSIYSSTGTNVYKQGMMYTEKGRLTPLIPLGPAKGAGLRSKTTTGTDPAAAHIVHARNSTRRPHEGACGSDSPAPRQLCIDCSCEGPAPSAAHAPAVPLGSALASPGSSSSSFSSVIVGVAARGKRKAARLAPAAPLIRDGGCTGAAAAAIADDRRRRVR